MKKYLLKCKGILRKNVKAMIFFFPKVDVNANIALEIVEKCTQMSWSIQILVIRSSFAAVSSICWLR